MRSRLRAFVVIAVAALAAAVPALASGTGASHGNKCGKGHAKHSKAIGKKCVKARHAAVVRQANRENESVSSEQAEDQAGTTDQADNKGDDDATENDQGDANDNDQGDDNDQADENDNAQGDENDD
jgi:hypothetical protein